MSWFYLALLAPFFFAIVNLIDDNLIHHVYKGPYLGVIISGIFGSLPIVSLLFLDTISASPLVVALAILAGFLTTVYYFFYFRALELESPSVVIAMFSLTPATVPIISYFLLGERLTYNQLIGFTIVLIASLALALVEIKGIRKIKFTSALIPVLVAAAIFDVIAIISKYVFQNTNFYTGYMYFSLGMGIGGYYFLLILLFLKTRNIWSDIRRNSKKILGLLVIAEFIAIAAEFTQNLAISRGPVSLVKVVEGIQPIYVLLIALLFYKFSPKHFREAAEGGLTKKFSLMFVIIIGLYFIGLNS